MRSISLAAITVSLLCVGCGSKSVASPHPSLAPSDDPLAPGDEIRVVFSEERQLSGEFPIDDTYNAALPILGRTSVEGVDGATLRNRLLEAYEGQLRNQAVQVTLLRRVRVLGEVREPGLYHVDPSMSLVDAIALAGGPTGQGRLDDVDILRDGRVVADDVETSALVASYLRSGDQIMVPKTSWISRNAAWVIGGTISAAAIITTAVINAGD